MNSKTFYVTSAVGDTYFKFQRAIEKARKT
jgi:hypothetical protein